MRLRAAHYKEVVDISTLLRSRWFENDEEAQAYVTIKIRSKETIVAYDESSLVGVLIFTRNFTHEAHMAEYIVVAKEVRRGGVATSLLEEYIAICTLEQPKKQPYALSSTDVKNYASIELHKKVGFVELGRIKKLHYGRDEIFWGYKLR